MDRDEETRRVYQSAARVSQLRTEGVICFCHGNTIDVDVKTFCQTVSSTKIMNSVDSASVF